MAFPDCVVEPSCGSCLIGTPRCEWGPKHWAVFFRCGSNAASKLSAAILDLVVLMLIRADTLIEIWLTLSFLLGCPFPIATRLITVRCAYYNLQIGTIKFHNFGHISAEELVMCGEKNEYHFIHALCYILFNRLLR